MDLDVTFTTLAVGGSEVELASFASEVRVCFPNAGDLSGTKSWVSLTATMECEEQTAFRSGVRVIHIVFLWNEGQGFAVASNDCGFNGGCSAQHQFRVRKEPGEHLTIKGLMHEQVTSVACPIVWVPVVVANWLR